MMKKWMMALAVVASVFSLTVFAQDIQDIKTSSTTTANTEEVVPDGRPIKIPLTEVPEVVMNAIKAKEKGIFFTQAERFWYRDMLTYQVVGRRFNEEWLFRVLSDGTILIAESDGR